MNKNRYEEAQGYYATGLHRVKTTKAPSGQKFPVGSFVKIAKDLGPNMSHFTSDKFAQVEYTYSHAFPPEDGYGGKDIKNYSLLIRYSPSKWSSSAWYMENQLTLVEDKKLIEQFKREIDSPTSGVAE